MRHAPGLGVALVMTAGALAACDAARPARPALWTLFDVQALYAKGASADDRIATDAGLPGGVAIGTMLDPDKVSLAVQRAWAEGYAAGYLTTEVWAHFDEVWAQPMYVPVAGWSDGAPQMPSAQPVFSVGADSLFYSPFWQMIYIQAADGAVRSTREILDGKYPQHPGKGWAAALVPADVGFGTAPVGGAAMGTGWLDGTAAPFVKFPVATVSIGDDAVVDEVPIFHFVFVKDDGTWVAPAIPAVLGTGPLYSKTPAPVDNSGTPTGAYSAYWRVYDVVVPPNALAFAPPGSLARTALDAVDLKTHETYGDDIAGADPAVLKDIDGRVATSPGCFSSLASTNPMLGSCLYLDSQHAIEAAVAPIAIVPTGITVTCPVVSVAGAPVQP